MEIKKISEVMWKISPNQFFISVLLAVVTGLCYALLVPFVLYAVTTDRTVPSSLEPVVHRIFESPTSEMAVLFFIICLSIITIKTVSSSLSAAITGNANHKLRISLYEKIQKLSLLQLDHIGQARLINLLNVDVPKITRAASMLPILWTSLITIFGLLGYLFYLDVDIFFFILKCLLFAVVTYQLPVILGVKFLSRGREEHDHIQKGVKGLINGAKELKLNTQKAQGFFSEELVAPEKRWYRANSLGMSIVLFAEHYGEIFSFLIIGLVIFHLPYIYAINQVELFGIVIVLIYLTGPVGFVLRVSGEIQQAKVSLRKLNEFYPLLVGEELTGKNKLQLGWSKIRLHDIGFRYVDSKDEFALHNVVASFEKGQISFIIGGNGSGKSTLSKLLTTHYQATAGEIYFDNQPLSSLDIMQVRSLISCIYTDFYVFNRMYGQTESIKVEQYLVDLELNDKVTIDAGRLSTTDLSDGQRKRLALLALLLEDRPICLFDEWAADQDPRFKEIFYYQILPKLKKQDKVVIIISHDDRYFKCADQLIVMDQGTVREIKPSHSAQTEFA